MCIIPTHEIGLFNAWMFIIPLMIVYYSPLFLHKKSWKRLVDTSWYEKKEKKLVLWMSLITIVLIIYTIWLPLPLGTIWFYIGLFFVVIGLIFTFIAFDNYASTPSDEPIITKGLYKISRNPIYFFISMTFIGISIASASWIMFLILVLYFYIVHKIILAEERYLLKTYGESYGEYKEKVPRYFLFF